MDYVVSTCTGRDTRPSTRRHSGMSECCGTVLAVYPRAKRHDLSPSQLEAMLVCKGPIEIHQNVRRRVLAGRCEYDLFHA